MIPSLERGCQLGWDLLFDGEMVSSARGADTLAAMGTLRLRLCRRPSDKCRESAGFQTAVVDGLLIALADWAGNNHGPQHEGGEEIE